MTTLPSGLPLTVDRAGGEPLAVQLSAQLQRAVTSGALHAGDRLPSSRDLAATLGVSRTVVSNAYARLLAEGWLAGRHGSGTYVAEVTPIPPVPAFKEDPERVSLTAPPSMTAQVDLQPGVSFAEGIDPAAWRRAWRQAGAHLP